MNSVRKSWRVEMVVGLFGARFAWPLSGRKRPLPKDRLDIFISVSEEWSGLQDKGITKENVLSTETILKNSFFL